MSVCCKTNATPLFRRGCCCVQIVFLTISMIAFFFVMKAIVDMFQGALSETQHEQAVHTLMERFLWLTLLVWALFPLVWTLAWLGYVSLGTEQVRSASNVVSR